jgi:Domain of unknown function (DUF4382)
MRIGISGLAFVMASIAFGGCGGTTCVSFFFNPGGGTVHVTAGNPPPPCTFPMMTSNLRIASIRMAECANCPSTERPRHIFVALRGIDLYSEDGPDDKDWIRLVPQLETRPLEIDLMEGALDGRSSALTEGVTTVPAGVYHHIRVRIASGQLPSQEIPVEEWCGTYGLNCVIGANNRILPIFPETSGRDAFVEVTAIPSGVLVIPAGGETRVGIEFMLSLRTVSITGLGVRLDPSLAAQASVEGRVTGYSAPE